MSLFYRIKQYPLEATLILSICVLIATIVLVGGTRSNRFADPGTKAAVGVQALNNSKEEVAIQKAVNHFEDSITLVKPTERLFLDYLQRKFSLPKTLGAQGTPIDLYENPRTYPEEIHYLARIALPNKVVKQTPGSFEESASLINVYSANCDHLSLPNNYWQIVDQNAKKGGYYLTHIALAFALMDSNKCLLPPAADILRNEVASGMVTLINDSKTTADLRYESVAFLFLMNRKDLVQTQWIDQIVQEQQSNGSWSQQAGDSRGDPHSTLLALWSLLEYARPNTPNEPLIHRPNN